MRKFRPQQNAMYKNDGMKNGRGPSGDGFCKNEKPFFRYSRSAKSPDVKHGVPTTTACRSIHTLSSSRTSLSAGRLGNPPSRVSEARSSNTRRLLDRPTTERPNVKSAVRHQMAKERRVQKPAIKPRTNVHKHGPRAATDHTENPVASVQLENRHKFKEISSCHRKVGVWISDFGELIANLRQTDTCDSQSDSQYVDMSARSILHSASKVGSETIENVCSFKNRTNEAMTTVRVTATDDSQVGVVRPAGEHPGNPLFPEDDAQLWKGKSDMAEWISELREAMAVIASRMSLSQAGCPATDESNSIQEVNGQCFVNKQAGMEFNASGEEGTQEPTQHTGAEEDATVCGENHPEYCRTERGTVHECSTLKGACFTDFEHEKGQIEPVRSETRPLVVHHRHSTENVIVEGQNNEHQTEGETGTITDNLVRIECSQPKLASEKYVITEQPETDEIGRMEADTCAATAASPTNATRSPSNPSSGVVENTNEEVSAIVLIDQSQVGLVAVSQHRAKPTMGLSVVDRASLNCSQLSTHEEHMCMEGATKSTWTYQLAGSEGLDKRSGTSSVRTPQIDVSDQQGLRRRTDVPYLPLMEISHQQCFQPRKYFNKCNADEVNSCIVKTVICDLLKLPCRLVRSAMKTFPVVMMYIIGFFNAGKSILSQRQLSGA